jgi:hypothetical protein
MDDMILTVTLPVAEEGGRKLVAGLPGVLEVTPTGGGLKVRYDLRRIRAQGIEDALGRAGHRLGGGVLSRLRRSWVEFQEGNMMAHAKVVPQCCSKPPK